MRLQDQALCTALLLLSGEESGPGGVFEYFSDTLVGLGRALEVLLGTNLLAHILGLGGVSQVMCDCGVWY
jgi:hypothetical protein